MNHEKTLYLVDGSGFIFRAYYGIRAPMSAKDGTPTNAVYGFTRLVLNLIKQRQPAYLAVTFDPKGPTFRNEIFAEYKANRDEPPEDLKPQFKLCRDATRALGISTLELSGYEADDIMGTVSKEWVSGDPERHCVLVTADKDMMQLVTNQVTMWDGKEKLTDLDGVVEKFGIPAGAVADLLGLAGDTSDNIPGVPGIGPKTAATLLQTYTSLDNLLEHAGDIKGKRGESLREFSDQALLSRTLATIKCDVPIEYEPTDLEMGEPNRDELADFFRGLNFNRFIQEFGLESESVPKVTIDRDAYRCVTDEAALKDLCTSVERAGRMAIDLETTSLSTLDASIVGFALAAEPGAAVYIPVGHTYENAPSQLPLETVMSHLGPLISNPSIGIIGQNLKYDMKVLRKCTGMDLAGITCDTMLAAYLLDPGRRQFGLDQLALDLLGHTMLSYEDVAGSKKDAVTFDKVPLDAATRYAAEDADIALRLAEVLMPNLKEEGLEALLADIELPLTRVIAKMETTGIQLNGDKLKTQAADYEERLDLLTDEIHTLADEPFNIDSPKQLGHILFERLGLPAEKKTKSGFSTDAQVLSQLSVLHPLPEKVLRYRHLTKLRNTYLDPLPTMVHPATGRLHTSFRQAVAATGRLSSSEPNLQNIPIRTPEGRAIREAFTAKPGWYLLSADYSQIELRLLAHYSKDPGLLSSFRDGADIHRRTAAQVFDVLEEEVTDDQRRQAKAVNFGLMYGMSAFRLSNELKIPQRVARGIIKKYFQQYAGVKAYFDQAIKDAQESKKATTLLGRTRKLAHINTKSFNLRQQAERLAINTPIQGSAADLLKLAMIHLQTRLEEDGLKSQMLLTVHDELVVEVPEDELEIAPQLVKDVMESVMSLEVPLVVEVGIGQNWAEIH